MKRGFPAMAALVFAVVAVPAAAVPAASPDEVFAFQDTRIRESSGLVDLGSTMATINDSGDSGRVFVVDARTGRTVGMTDYTPLDGDDPVDVESIAPAGGGSVWVGDTGDNTENREDVVVYRVPVAARQIDVRRPEAYRLRYPDGPHDAESMFEGPDRALWIITKSFAGGLVFRTPGPPRAGATTTLKPVGRVDDYATDAALLPDGKHVLVRSLAQATIYTFPGFDVVSRFPLPPQVQGEGVSVGPGGRVRLSSEGVHAPVLQITLPVDLSPGSPTPTPSDVPQADVPRSAPSELDDSNVLAWAVAGIVGVVAAGVAISLRRRR